MLSGNKRAKELLAQGATVIDVRTPKEFQGGHVVNSINIPLNEVESRLEEIKSIPTPVVLCCRSGARSGQAAQYLQSQGIDCENGGGWTQVNAMLG